MNESERAARRAAAGNVAAFGIVVRLHQSNVRAFLLRLTGGQRALADDLAQETFLEAWRKIRQYRGEGSFAGWLYGIAWSRYLMHVRKRRPEQLDEDYELSGDEGSAEMRLDLERAMARLHPNERAALTACYAMGFSHEEAAAILRMPLGTVKSHVARGREKLQTLLQDWKDEL
jgi:RNA polymerase sigma-70 factor (ECF subfamily)